MKSLLLLLTLVTIFFPQFIVPITPPAAGGGTNPIDPSRLIDWTQVGAGVIPHRTTDCADLTSTATSANITSALNSCSSGGGGVVNLAAGTYTLTAFTISNAASNVTLRGAGPDQTILSFSGTTGCAEGHPAAICIAGGEDNDDEIGGHANQSNWTAGFTKGATSVTLSAQTLGSTAPKVGSLIDLVQTVNGTTRGSDTWPDVFVCVVGGGVCDQGSASSPGSVADEGTCPDANRCWAQFQLVKVTGVTGSSPGPYTVTFTPPLMMPNWGQTATMAWWSNGASIQNFGLEDLQVRNTGALVWFRWAVGSWWKNVEFYATSGSAAHYTGAGHSALNTIRDSFIFGTGSGDDYAWDCYACSSFLIENNLSQYARTMWINEMGNGHVFAYNLVIQSYNGTNSQSSFYNHGSGMGFQLVEGNEAFGNEYENYFGMAHFNTSFRNRLYGDEPSGIDQAHSTNNSFALTRYENIVGNVLGTVGTQTTYQKIANDGHGTGISNTIFCIGNGDNCKSGGSGSFPADDSHAVESLFRWGNWDTVTNAVRWCVDSTAPCTGSEVPSGLSLYANPVPSSHTLPSSLYLSGKPAFYGSQTWPSNGPDVTGGNVSNSGGHSYKIPMRVCFDSVMGGSFTDTSPKTFNWTTLCQPVM